MPINVFISHSTDEKDLKDPANVFALAFEKALLAKLKPEFGVQMDRLRLEPGDRWRPIINTWIGGSHAAVLLISERATRSSYTVYEASVLAYRHLYEKTGFLLLPVLLDPVTLDTVHKGPFGPCCIKEIQLLQANPGNMQQVIDQVVDKLRQVQAGHATHDLHARQLEDLLKKAGSAAVDRAETGLTTVEPGADPASIVAVPDMMSWTPNESRELRVARRMIAAGLSHNGGNAIFEIDSQFLTQPNDRDSVFELVAGGWVDVQSQTLLRAVADPKAPRCFLMNAARLRTAKVFVHRASTDAFPRPWDVATLSSVTSGSLADLEQSIVRALAQVLRSPNDTPAEVDTDLKIRAKRGKPTFVAIQLQMPDSATLKHLQTRFPTVGFIFLVGDQTDPSITPQGVMVLPQLDENAETDFECAWEETRRLLKHTSYTYQP